MIFSLPSSASPSQTAFASPDLFDGDVVRELGPGLLAQAYRRVGNRQDAEDLVQEMWCSALRSASGFEGRSSLRTWLGTILMRRIAERFRRGRVLSSFDEESFTPDSEPGFERHDLELAQRLTAGALATLSLQERAAFRLCDLEEVEREHACEQLGITRGHLRILLHRARRKLVDYAATHDLRATSSLRLAQPRR
jgi:RNA polymerase sigma-70 factor, ECF subfamily